MTDTEYEQFKEFIYQVLYEKTTLDDYEVVLNALEIPIVSKGQEYWTLKSGCHNADCSCCGNNLVFYVEERSFYCFSECHSSYNLLSLTRKRFETLGESKSITQSLKFICERVAINFDFKEEVKRGNGHILNWKRQLLKYTKHGEEFNTERKKYDKHILTYFDNAYYEDWLKEGLSVDALNKFGIKWYNREQQIVIPCYDRDANLVGIRVRNTNPDMADKLGKYRPLEMLNGMVYKFPTNDYFYGENLNSDYIRKIKKCCLVESEKAVIKSETFFGRKNFCLGLMGHSIGQEQINYLVELGVKDIYLCLDWDYHSVNDDEYDTYVEGVNKLYFKMKPYFSRIFVIVNPEEYNEWYKCNIFDLPKDKFVEIWDKRELIIDGE